MKIKRYNRMIEGDDVGVDVIERDLDMTGALAYLEGNLNYLQETDDRHCVTAQDVIDETVSILYRMRMGLYKSKSLT